MAEGFIGRAALRAEILALTLPAGLAGAGLIWLGAARIGAPLTEAGGWHLALMGLVLPRWPSSPSPGCSMPDTPCPSEGR